MPPLLLAALLALVSAAPPQAVAQTAAEPVPTRLLVRAVAQDAKVIGDGVGGARITIRDLDTGHLLAQGVQQGGTGDTERIMRTPHARGAVRYDTEGTAGYEATLMLDRPTRVEIVAEGPLGYPQAMNRAAATMLVVPGQDVGGDGIVLTLHGFIVTVDPPEPASPITVGEVLDVTATVRLMCGCPTEPGGLWDSDAYTLQARLVRDGDVLAEAPLTYAGTTSTFTGTLSVPEAGALELHVLAADAAKANFGQFVQPLTVQQKPGSH